MSLPWRAAHLIALSAIAVTQPVLDLLGGSPTFFVAHTAGPAEVLLVGLLAITVVPVALIAVEVLVTLVSRRWGWRLHLVLVVLLGGLIAAQTIDRIPALPTAVVLGGGAALGILLGRVYGRHELVRSALSALAFTPLLFAGVFVFASPTHGLVFPPDVAAAEVRVPGTPPPVFVIVFDELPLASVLTADGQAIDRDRFPNLGRLADDGVWFPNATSVAGFTHEAVPAILTGDRVHAENVPPTAGGHPRNLFTLLAEDYRIESREQITQLCTPVLCDESSGFDDDEVPTSVLLKDLAVVSGLVSLPAGLDGWLPQVDDSWAYFGEGSADLDQEADRLGDDRAEFVTALGRVDRVGEFRQTVDGIQRNADPTLTFLHMVFPHVPWTFHAGGEPYADPGRPGLTEEGVWTTAFSADFALQQHLLQAQFADRLLGELLGRIDETGQYEDSMIVFVADHGVSLEPGTNRRLPTGETLPAIMSVPLLVKAPAGDGAGFDPASAPLDPGSSDNRVAETVDLMPTIADLLGVDVPWPVDGQSLFGPQRTTVERSIYARGNSETTDERRLDVQPAVDRIRDTFGRGDHLELYGLGSGRSLVGRRASRAAIDGSTDACWAATPVAEGSVGLVQGSIRTEEPGDLSYAVVIDGRVAGTSVTYDDGEGDPHRVLALVDPALWRSGGDTQLWQVVERGRGPGLVRLPAC